MTGLRKTALALMLTLPAMMSSGAKAEPKVLTGSAMDVVRAGVVVLAPLQINVNANAQAAIATSVAVSFCAVCNNPVVQAVAPASAVNINIAALLNQVN